MAGLYPNDTPWPPPEEARRYKQMRTSSVWYAGDPGELAAFYAGGGGSSLGSVGYASPIAHDTSVIRRAVNTIRRWFWQGDPDAAEETTSRLHVPVAQDISTLSAELVASEAPKITVVADDVPQFDDDGEPALDSNGDPMLGPHPDTLATQERLEHLLRKSGWESLLLAGLETSSALGALGLRIAWDRAVVKDRPFITRVDADALVLRFEWGQLVGVCFWREVSRDTAGNDVWRHLEMHEAGRVLHGLYQGNSDNLGKAQPLTDRPETRGFAEDPLFRLFDDGWSGFETVEGYNTATAIPNMLPDPSDRQSQVGRSDYTPGVISLFDAIDRVYSSLMTDIELGQGRLVVPAYMLDEGQPGQGASFNLDTKMFTGLPGVAPSDDGGGADTLTIVQFKIRVDEHLSTLDHLIGKAVKSAGFSPQTMGDATDAAGMTATESLSRDRRALSTRDKKIKYLEARLEDFFETLLAVDNAYFNRATQVLPVRVQFPDAVQPDQQALAQTANLLHAAEAASVETLVRTVHPDWDDTQIRDEVAKIEKQAQATAAANALADPAQVGPGGYTNQDAQDTGADPQAQGSGADGQGQPMPGGPTNA